MISGADVKIKDGAEADGYTVLEIADKVTHHFHPCSMVVIIVMVMIITVLMIIVMVIIIIIFIMTKTWIEALGYMSSLGDRRQCKFISLFSL